jgi:formylglycine-generating enzyme required for sulfatase activity
VVIERALAEADPEARARQFDDLGLRQADTRPGVGLKHGLPDVAWRRVPSASFWMGGDPLALGAWSGRSVQLETDYWTGAYPVTVAQYQTFIDDGGYSEDWRSCWTSIGWAWRKRYTFSEGLADQIGNHPVAVDWYEAYAFAAWLEALRRAGRLSLPSGIADGHVIRLPDEAEREWMTRYPDGRLFPWGNSYQNGAANIDETRYRERVGPHYLGRVTSVGIYPLGVQPNLGIYDLSGNLSEWCLTTWSEAGYTADNSPDAVGHRVVRGGHYHNGAYFARAASRTWGDPDPDEQYDPSHGFRVVVGPPFVSTVGHAYAAALRWRAEHGL